MNIHWINEGATLIIDHEDCREGIDATPENQALLDKLYSDFIKFRSFKDQEVGIDYGPDNSRVAGFVRDVIYGHWRNPTAGEQVAKKICEDLFDV